MTSYNKEKWIWECPVCALSPPPIHPLSVYLLFHPLWLWYPKNNNNNSCEKLFPFILCLLFQHLHSSVSVINIIVSSFFSSSLLYPAHIPYLSYPHTFHHQQHHHHQHHHHHQNVHRHYHQESCSCYIQVADSPSSYLDEQFITSILTHSRTANAPYDDLLWSWHYQESRSIDMLQNYTVSLQSDLRRWRCQSL